MRLCFSSPNRAFPAKGVGGAASIAAALDAANRDATGTPFYLEIGDKTGPIVQGSFGTPSILIDTQMSIASASKWVFGMYAAQAVTLGSADWAFLNMSSGYIGMTGQCAQTDSVNSCLARTGYDTYYPAADGVFYYNSAHFEHFAAHVLGLGADKIVALKTKFEALLGVSPLAFTQPMMAGGMYTTPGVYAQLLRKVLDGTFAISELLGLHTVPASALLGATHSPAPINEAWNYGVCTWIEPDGSFSAGGSFGFYPSIDKNRKFYFIIARDDESQSQNTIGMVSVRTGQMIRNAFLNP